MKTRRHHHHPGRQWPAATAALLCLVFVGGGAVDSTADESRKTLNRVQAHYLAMSSVTIDFTERFRNRATGTVLEESGKLFAARPGKMRWEYLDPEPKLFVLADDVAWFYVPEDEVVYRIDASGAYRARIPSLLLTGEADLLSTYDALPEDSPSAGIIRLRLQPVGASDDFDYLLTDIDAETAALRGLIVVDALGNRTEFTFADERPDPQIADGAFTFEPPDGIEIVAAD